MELNDTQIKCVQCFFVVVGVFFPFNLCFDLEPEKSQGQNEVKEDEQKTHIRL